MLVFISDQIFAQNQSMNMIELGSFDPTTEDYNDVWGFELSGKQYAVLGSVGNIYIVDVSVCSNPVQKAVFSPPGSNNIWRDFKTYNGYVFGVCDNCGEGLVIIDANSLPSGTPTMVYQSSDFFTSAHNIYIEGNYLYAVGTNTQPEGIIVLDISTPSAPTLEISVNLDIQRHGSNTPTNYYIHDINVSNGIAYCSHIYWHDFATWNVSDLTNISFIDSYTTGNYTHSSWNSGNMIYVCEEVPGGMPVQVLYQDATGDNLSFVTSFQNPIETVPSGCTSNRPHNPFVKGDTLFISYYHDGIHLYDVSTPQTPQHIGYYDTYPLNDGETCPYNGFDGAWGVYPYLSNGCILVSDDTYGLRILRYSPVVPVVWKNFSVAKKANKVELIWGTGSEVNNDYFEIVRSRDGIAFEPIGTVAGAGTFEYENKYSFLDQDPLPGKSYYKIKQVDFDGATTSTDIKSIILDASKSFKIAPNPIVNNTINIQSDLKLKTENISLFDVMGRQIAYSLVQENENSWAINPNENLSSGCYFISISGGNNIIERKNIYVK